MNVRIDAIVRQDTAISISQRSGSGEEPPVLSAPSAVSDFLLELARFYQVRSIVLNFAQIAWMNNRLISKTEHLLWSE